MVDNVNGIGGVSGGSQSRKIKSAYQGPEKVRGEDSIQISSDVMRIKGMDDVRLDKVMEIRRAIEAGTYLNSEKLDKALDGAIDEALGKK